MLSPSEKLLFKEFESLDPKVRSNLVFRVSKKIKKAFSDLSEIDEILNTVPEKTAQRLLNDDIVNSMLTLSEDSIKILGYAPVKYDNFGRPVVLRKTPLKSKTRTFEITYDIANTDDIARVRLVEDHIKVLQYILSADSGFPVWKETTSPISNAEFLPVDEALDRWSRPRINNLNAPEGHTI